MRNDGMLLDVHAGDPSVWVFLLDVDGLELHVDVRVESGLVSFARASMDEDGSLGGWKRPLWMTLLEERAKARATAAAAATVGPSEGAVVA